MPTKKIEDLEIVATTKKLEAIEIFSAGVWNGDPYTESDLDEIIRAFDENKKGFRPYIKLGHDPKQALLQNDGLPAAGYVDKLYRVGKKLLADIVDIPSKIYSLVDRKAYTKVSSEIYWGVDINGKKYSKMLGAVAFLGADMPGVMNLNDILAQYGLKSFQTIKNYASGENALSIKNVTYSYEPIEEKEMQKTEREIQLEEQLRIAKEENKNLNGKVTTFTSDIEKRDQELADAKKLAEESQAALQKSIEDANSEKVKRFCAELKAEKLITPAMESRIEALLGPEKKEYTIKVEKEDKQLSKFEILKDVLKLYAAASKVNFDENSEDGKGNSDKAGDQEKAIEEYMADKKCDYTTAYKAVAPKFAETDPVALARSTEEDEE